MSTSNTTLVFITFKSAHLLSSIANCQITSPLFIYDNASTDNTVEKCHQMLPKAQILAGSTNIGYGRAANVAFKQLKTPYALLLNPDVTLNSEQLDAMLELPEQLENDWLYIAPDSGHVVTTLDISSTHDALTRITHATGCALLFNLENFKKLGGFDENIFLYYEEMDLSIRAHNNGLKMYYAKDIKLPHNSKQSVASSNDLDAIRNWHFQWSSLYYKKKHGLWPSLIESLFKNLLILPIKQLAADNSQSEKYKIKHKATIAFLKGQQAFKKNGGAYKPHYLSNSCKKLSE